MCDARPLMASTGTQARSGRPIAAALVRLCAAAVFIAFGIGKFTSHASELASFRDYGLPAPDAFVYLVGVIEIVGGLLLLAGVGTRAASAVLAGNMVGAIVVSGIGRGEQISLTLAPALLVAMLFLLWRGPGAWTLGAAAAAAARRRA
jgi:putative oxidoreductase